MSIEKIKLLRKELHKYPELSGQEKETAGRIQQFIKKHHHTKIIEGIGGNGLAVVHEYANSGPNVVIRCELDALPIEEVNDFEHRSLNHGISHKCGHDGHMAMVAGLIFWLKEQNFNKGKVILLFQPAEETGAGAIEVLKDERFGELNPDYVFALHNIPGQPLHSIIILDGNFSSTVQSFAIQLKGKECHSAEPEHGVNPALGIAELIQKFDKLNNNDPAKEDFRLCVPVFSSMGVKSYGISAGYGELHYTIRTKSADKMEILKQDIISILLQVCHKHNLLYTTKWFDYFPEVRNDRKSNQIIMETAKFSNFDIIMKSTAFKFGEDFGWFSKKYKAAMFGLGAGLQSPVLHSANYDFPDDILETGMTMFKGIIERILSDQKSEHEKTQDDEQ